VCPHLSASLDVAEKWWRSQFLLPGATQPLSKDQQIAITHSLAAWTEVVEGLPEDARGTTADHLRAAWKQLLASGKLEGEGQAELAGQAWRWREHLQRAMDGCHSTEEQRCVRGCTCPAPPMCSSGGGIWNTRACQPALQ